MAFNIVGTESHISNVASPQSTTSMSYVPYLQYTTPTLNGGLYRIGWYLDVVKDGPILSLVQVKVTLDSSEILYESDISYKYDLGNYYHVGVHALEAGTHDINIEYRKIKKNKRHDAAIRLGYVELWRVN